MTDDIVKRLRKLVDTEDMHPLSIFAETICDAADEIERLRAEVERLTREWAEKNAAWREQAYEDAQKYDAAIARAEAAEESVDEYRDKCNNYYRAMIGQRERAEAAEKLCGEAADTIGRAKEWQAYSERMEREADAAMAEEIQETRRKNVEYRERANAAEAKVTELREALKPFGAWCSEMEDYNPNIEDDVRVASTITMEDTRRARAVLQETEQ